MHLLKIFVFATAVAKAAPLSEPMKHLAAYLLLGLGGNTSPTAADIKATLDSVGIEADDERLDKLLEELEGKDINELIAARNTQLASDDQFDTQLRKRSKEGELFPRNVDVEVGDKVLFDKYSGTEVKVDGEELLVLREGDILAVIELRGED